MLEYKISIKISFAIYMISFLDYVWCCFWNTFYSCRFFQSSLFCHVLRCRISTINIFIHNIQLSQQHPNNNKWMLYTLSGNPSLRGISYLLHLSNWLLFEKMPKAFETDKSSIYQIIKISRGNEIFEECTIFWPYKVAGFAWCLNQIVKLEKYLIEFCTFWKHQCASLEFY